MSNPVLEANNLQKAYHDGKLLTSVIKQVDFQLNAKEKLAIVGSSGSGKSTLLHLLAGLDTPSDGKVSLMGQNFSDLNEAKRGYLRNEHLGFVYQFHFLLPELTALENAMLPLRVRRTPAKVAEKEARFLLERVGLGHRLEHKPSELSGGERQRVAMARALITKPACILADEPTGNLDEHSAQQVFELMLELNQELETALLIVTHDLSLAARMDRQLYLRDGTLHEMAASN
ncbi:lipoprotein-releasing ABC transporter ATP-binding protein LolD [Thiosulfativibrio zosterae]|uniref:Lipoprotein-releasing system ATP-binding protein LolD n=1 Tax=Thiosulfativibrio zosterae TaxID=2675053 RepID=A0A6F8PN69_9GAMM|nr:lipoprotein-releasing ABC transporter ATP-binding protein LolD [Thiosulfativibrio zosterae]BBP43545.1 lipoprotein-releasing system ATP-binding protein LolD [Thiosulfativibrio zosterae]